VVDTPDAVLVTTRARAQEVKAIVQRLKAAGRGDLL
jgi:mannose-1-phosphate guanylyltransferase